MSSELAVLAEDAVGQGGFVLHVVAGKFVDGEEAGVCDPVSGGEGGGADGSGGGKGDAVEGVVEGVLGGGADLFGAGGVVVVEGGGGAEGGAEGEVFGGRCGEDVEV